MISTFRCKDEQERKKFIGEFLDNADDCVKLYEDKGTYNGHDAVFFTTRNGDTYEDTAIFFIG